MQHALWSVPLVVGSVSALVLWMRGTTQAGAVDIAVALLGVVACYAAVGMLVVRRDPAPASRVVVAGAAFLGWSLVSSLASGRGWTAFSGEMTSMLGWLTLASVAAIALAAGVFGADLRRLLSRYAWVIVLAQAVVSLGEIARGAVATGTLPNSTYYGEAVLLLLPWTMAGLDEAGPAERGMRYGTATGTVLLLAAGGSRAALACAVIWFIWVAAQRWGTSLSTRVAIGASVVAAAAASAYIYARGEVLGTANLASTLGLRPALWKLAWSATLERPLLGWGPDGFIAGGAAASTLELAQRETLPVFQPGSTDPHALLLWVSVSAGIVGLALFAWFAVETALVWHRDARYQADRSPAAWAVATFGVVSLLSPVAIQVLPLFGLVLGLSVVTEPSRAGAGADVTVSRRFLPLWAMRLGLVVLAAAAFFLAADSATRAIYEEASFERSPRIAVSAQRASDLWAFDAHMAYLASLHWGYAAQGDPAIASKTPDLASVERATSLDSRNPFYALEAARTLRFYGAAPAVIEAAFAETFERYPFNPLARAEYAYFLAEQGQRAEAERQLALAQLGDQTGNDERLRVIQATRAILDKQ